MIRFSAVAKRYPNGHEALSDVTFGVGAGELVVVTGHSGAGKSTLLKLASGIERATRGSVVVSGQNLSSLGETALAILRRHIGFVFQDHKLLFDRPAWDNVALPLRIAGAGADDAGRRVRAALDKVGLLGREKAMPITLSGGEQQRLCIARAIVNRPAILVADEPTGNLDAVTAEEVFELFESLVAGGRTIVMVTHDPDLAARTRRTVHMVDGRILDGTLEEPETAA
jgi:cell division transport system ATP-binding protein